eukprot:CAMPEP_0204831568 /NCGR_PEP_ID=MMETSP1346-20131115/10859_1 /ASSEMBLY_ACC=CAM_ASM_000771 /TAXON_ID=215587 /ORGANISM="Aplanochytrium stocchinoi, Strain GSBS06" /LENGTH=222 /DNA_ID=CAMNT_0051962671 /DNA_START=224 /DNA_END=893 /DNA_ORIENTATION=-
MLQEYKPDDFMTDPVAVAVKGELVPNKITQNGVIRRPIPSNVESDDCGSDCDGDAELSAPKLRHRFIPGTACVLGPKIPGVFDAFVFAMLLYIFAAVVVYSIGMYQFEENLHFLIWIMIAWILSGFAAFTATTLTDPGIVPPASPEGFRERVERMTKEDKETMRACEHCNLIVQIVHGIVPGAKHVVESLTITAASLVHVLALAIKGTLFPYNSSRVGRFFI